MIVPFRGSDAELDGLRARLEAIVRRPGDEIIVSDNRQHPIHTPAFARDRGAERASGEWLVFIDADTTPQPTLLDAYFEPPPAETTAILAGGIRDQAPAEAGVVERYGVARAHMGERLTLNRAGTPYAPTANCAVRRSAFEAVGGFEQAARAGEDADLCFRIIRAGWALEERPGAVVEHRPRATLRASLAQLAIHGSGAAWLERRWPGEFPPAKARAFAGRLARHAADAGLALLHGDAERAAFALLDLLGACAFELGRLLPNERKLRG